MTTGIQTLNSENEAARFSEVLNDYFRVSTASGKRPKAHQRQIENDSQTCLKQLKRILRDATAAVQSQYIQKLYQTTLYQLKRARTSPTIFDRVLDLCQEIFQRSALFRALIVAKTAFFFHQLLLAAGEDPSAKVSRALIARSRGSKQLTTVLTLIETWTHDFGEQHPSIVAGYSTLVERGYHFPHERMKQQEEKTKEAEREKQRERVTDAKNKQRDREMKRYVPEMETVLIEMNRVFEILVPTLDAFLVEKHDDEKLVVAPSTKSKDLAKDRDEWEHSRAMKKQDNGQDNQWQAMATTGMEEEAEDDESIKWESVIAEGIDALNENRIATETNDEDSDEYHMDVNDIVQAYGLGSSAYQLTIEVSKTVCEESSNNEALFKVLADNALCIQKRFLPLVDDWEQHSTLTRQRSSKSSTQREVLQHLHDLRDRLTRALLKWNDLQGSNNTQQAKSAVVHLPIDSYYRTTKRSRRERWQQ